MNNNPAFPNITYHRGASGLSVPIVKGTGVRVQTLAIASEVALESTYNV
ncbi:hypothetical protein ACE1CI_00900 [Aerosakkonemataceae cyanobacterium BLCC-F50]|uniref:Uncharacterized protein n=1 Tax=Floridaenema flaviceps BLCC-F50 TaxID=3153642 RepID=A0ABV4XK58_9CYAN